MTNSFQSDIKSILININNGDYSTLKDNYNKVFGEEGYDRLIYSINSIENNNMINGTYEKNDSWCCHCDGIVIHRLQTFCG